MPLKPMWLMLCAFIAGCVASSVVRVPAAEAQPRVWNGARWQHWCLDVEGVPTAEELDRPSNEGWEMVSATFRPPVVAKGDSVGGGATLVCFKRPL